MLSSDTVMLLLTILLAAIPCAFAVPAPGACSGACGTHDPSVARRADGTYFLFSTNNHVATASAPSLAGPWTSLGAALPGALKLSQGTDIWVCNLHCVKLADPCRLPMYHLLAVPITCIMQSAPLERRSLGLVWQRQRQWSQALGQIMGV